MIRFIQLIITLFVLTSCKDRSQATKAETDKQKDSLTMEIKGISQNGVFNGFAVSIVNDQGTLYQNGFGFSDIQNQKKYTDSTYRILAQYLKHLLALRC